MPGEIIHSPLLPHAALSAVAAAAASQLWNAVPAETLAARFRDRQSCKSIHCMQALSCAYAGDAGAAVRTSAGQQAAAGGVPRLAR